MKLIIVMGIVLVVILFLVLLLLFIKVEIELISKDFKYEVYAKLFGVIKINVKDKTMGKNKNKDDNKRDFSKLKAFLEKENKENIGYLLSKSDMRITGCLEYGAETPDVTAISYGIIYGVLYCIDNILQTTFKTYYRDYTIKPDMKNKKLEYQVTISVYTRIIYYLIYKLRRNTKKLFEKDGVNDDSSSNRRFNENHHG